MAVLKHNAIKNKNYSDALNYMIFEHEEFTNKIILDDNGRPKMREKYILDGIGCDPFTFPQECQSLNYYYRKNRNPEDIKSHHYIIAFDPRDATDNNLTMERAQQLGLEFCRKNFPGHQALVCTHPDGHNLSGNIHVHIVINSLRKDTVDREDFMTKPCEYLAGYKHNLSTKYERSLKGNLMELCQREGLYQVDLLSDSKKRMSEREYFIYLRGKQKSADGQYKTEREILRESIAEAVQTSDSFAEFTQKLFADYGISLTESRGALGYLLPERLKPIRARNLGAAYDIGNIIDALQQHRSLVPDEKEWARAKERIANLNVNPDGITRFVNVEAIKKAKNNYYYRRSLDIKNLKLAASTLVFLQKNNITTFEQLTEIVDAASAEYKSARFDLRETENKIRDINMQIRYAGQYLANKKAYKEYLSLKGNPKKMQAFRKEHETSIVLYEEARSRLRELTKDEKMPMLSELKARKEELLSKKNIQYERYSEAKDMKQTIDDIRLNVERMYNKEASRPAVHEQGKDEAEI